MTEHVKIKRRMGTKSAGGEIVEVQGGYIVRSMGRKDRHSKVYTSKGARDRRVRLAAHTAIQFYDVQDRLGYDRPSKAVDWLINKAKSAIDKLDVPPPWRPIAEPEPNNSNEAADGSANIYRLCNDPRKFIETQEIANFLPTSSNASLINFQSFPSDVISRKAIHSQDFGLSLHSFQDPGLIGQSQGNTRPIFGSGSSVSMGFEADFHRMVAWNNETSTGNSSGGGCGGGFVFNSLSQQTEIGQILQRGTLQSSFLQSVHAWNNIPNANLSVFGSRFAPEGLLGFCIPSQIRGEDEHSVVLDRPTSSSPNSHH